MKVLGLSLGFAGGEPHVGAKSSASASQMLGLSSAPTNLWLAFLRRISDIVGVIDRPVVFVGD
jgi:hypothetical protein